jgi:hypothetical protein
LGSSIDYESPQISKFYHPGNNGERAQIVKLLNIFLGTLFSNTLNLLSPLGAKDEVSYLYKITDKVRTLFIVEIKIF